MTFALQTGTSSAGVCLVIRYNLLSFIQACGSQRIFLSSNHDHIGKIGRGQHDDTMPFFELVTLFFCE